MNPHRFVLWISGNPEDHCAVCGKAPGNAIHDVIVNPSRPRDCADCERCIETCDMTTRGPGDLILECVNCDNCEGCACPKDAKGAPR